MRGKQGCSLAWSPTRLEPALTKKERKRKKEIEQENHSEEREREMGWGQRGYDAERDGVNKCKVNEARPKGKKKARRIGY